MHYAPLISCHSGLAPRHSLLTASLLASQAAELSAELCVARDEIVRLEGEIVHLEGELAWARGEVAALEAHKAEASAALEVRG